MSTVDYGLCDSLAFPVPAFYHFIPPPYPSLSRHTILSKVFIQRIVQIWFQGWENIATGKIKSHYHWLTRCPLVRQTGDDKLISCVGYKFSPTWSRIGAH